MPELSPGSFNDFTAAAGLDPATTEAVDAYTVALGDNYRQIHAGDPIPVLSLVGAQVVPITERAVA